MQLAEQALQDGTCPHCGQARELCEDPQRVWYPQRVICFATMESRRAQRAYEKRHEKTGWHDGTFTLWADKETEQTPYRHDDGVTILVATEDLQPDDDFLSGKLRRATMGG